MGIGIWRGWTTDRKLHVDTVSILTADAKADEADKAHVSDVPGEADVVGVENKIVRSLFKRSPKTSGGI